MQKHQNDSVPDILARQNLVHVHICLPGATPGGGTEKVGGGTMEGWGTAGGGCPGGGI